METFNALVDKLSLALRWKARIKRHFCREAYFNQLLRKLSSNTDINPIAVEKDKKIAEKLRKQNPNMKQPEIMKLIAKEWKRSAVNL